MAVHVILFLSLFTGLCVADSKGNLALRATAVQSSTYNHLTAAQNAVDGNRYSCSHTKGDMNPWWRVDLLEVYGVTRVSITNRGDGYAERINGAQIRIGNSLDNNGNNNELAATVVSIPLGQTKTFEFKSIMGRYVNLFIPGRNEYLTLCEVEVFGEKYRPSCPCVPRNLALRATAVQSSTYNHLTAAQNAIDGNRHSCSHTKGDMNSWWRVDLFEVYGVTRVSITNRGDGYAERINGAQIHIGNSLDNNGNNNELAATVESIPLGQTKTFEFKSIMGRYVNLFIPGRNEYLTLCEVEVFGEKYRPSCPCVPRNLALRATAVQSSTYNHLTAAQNAVDGNRHSCSHTKGDMNSWWRVDLLEVYGVTRVSITNRGDGYAERINGAQIHIGNSLDNNGNNNELAATAESIPLGQTKTFEFKSIMGRYVNLFIPGRNEYLTLCEVEVFADKYTSAYNCVPRNLALRASAVHSSTYDQAGAQYAVDGIRHSCSHTKWDMNPWWRVDLLEVYGITRVSIANRGDGYAERINGAQIRIGNSLENNGNNNELAAVVESIPLGETKTFEFKPINGQYVNIFILGRNEYLTLCEVEVFAD